VVFDRVDPQDAEPGYYWSTSRGTFVKVTDGWKVLLLEDETGSGYTDRDALEGELLPLPHRLSDEELADQLMDASRELWGHPFVVVAEVARRLLEDSSDAG
jgi:hypothetical protein